MTRLLPLVLLVGCYPWIPIGSGDKSAKNLTDDDWNNAARAVAINTGSQLSGSTHTGQLYFINAMIHLYGG